MLAETEKTDARRLLDGIAKAEITDFNGILTVVRHTKHNFQEVGRIWSREEKKEK